MNRTTSTPSFAALRPFGLESTFDRLFGLAHFVMEIARQRRDLASLDDRMLADIGYSRSEADAEASRPFWDLPTGQLIRDRRY
ncbi:MAG: DUF1127 domain-containing protein [Rhodospirillaceae bacterium]